MLSLLGLNHRSAPVSFRERVGFKETEIPEELARLCAEPGIEEALILSTCNRVEVLVRGDAPRKAAAALDGFLARERHVTPEEIERYTYRFDDLEAVRHLFHVAAGLDSMVLGEPQILGQVKRAYAIAREAGTTGAVLDHLLQQTLAAAKRVRTDTGISRHAVSVAFAAVTLAKKIFGDLRGHNALLLGAGKMTELAARHLVGNGIENVTVTNRTYTRAVELAREFGGNALYWEEAFDHLERIDIVITGTAAPEPVLLKHHVQDAMRKRRSRPLFIVDIAVPRDVDPAVNELDNVYLYDIDELQSVVDSSLEERKAAAEKASTMLESEVKGFDFWRQTLTIAPTIAAMSEHLHEVGRGEIERFRRRMQGLSPEQEKVVEELVRAVVRKILHPAIRTLKGSLQRGRASDVASLYSAVFGLEPRPGEALARSGEPPAGGAERPGGDESPRGPQRIVRGGRE
jgi:glutamyl-tRNA reductase